MIKYCEECKYAKPNIDLVKTLCTNKTMPTWFNVVIFQGRVACNKFEKKTCVKESTQKSQTV